MEMVHFIPPSQRRFVLLAAQADSAPVLIYGAAGTGKGAIASWIHLNGPRATYPFVIGHQAKPLADQILEAQGGTLAISEIGKWTLSEQKTLLNYLKTKTIPDPSQDLLPRLVNVRIIGTTSQALESRAQGGLFNQDLLDKLNVFRIDMPSLTSRRDEFQDIALGIVREITRELGKEHLRSLSAEAWIRLISHDWPGNLRELRNILRFGVIAAKGDQIENSDLPDFSSNQIDFRTTREEFERIYILELLKTFNWEIDRTCVMTHIDKNTLLTKIKNYGIPLGN